MLLFCLWSGTKKEPKPKLLSPDIFWWGGGLPRVWVGAKKFSMHPGILLGYPGSARKVWEKNVWVRFSSPIWFLRNEAHILYFLGPGQEGNFTCFSVPNSGRTRASPKRKFFGMDIPPTSECHSCGHPVSNASVSSSSVGFTPDKLDSSCGHPWTKPQTYAKACRKKDSPER